MNGEETQQIKDALRRPRLHEPAIPKSDYLSTGSTLLDLACSGSIIGGLTKGRYFWMVGDSSSGKTFLTLTILAEASINKNFDDYDLIFDNAEDGALMSVETYFGSKMAERLQPPAEDEYGPLYSRLAEDFYFILDDRLSLVEKGKAPPFIYLLDSMDALSTKYEGEKFTEKKNAARKGRKAKGDYGDGKAKINSTWIRGVMPRLRDTGSILIILSQTRDNIDAGMFEPQSTHAGGRSLKFYATWQLWSSVGSKITKEVKGEKVQIGVNCNIKVKKNRLTGRESTVTIPIYYSYGIDDIGSCVDYLAQWRWGSSGGIIQAKDFDFSGRRDALINQIENNDQVTELKILVKKTWEQIQEECVLDRKSKYQ